MDPLPEGTGESRAGKPIPEVQNTVGNHKDERYQTGSWWLPLAARCGALGQLAKSV